MLRESTVRACLFYLAEPVVGYILEDDWLHGENISKLHLRDVQSADDMGPA